MGVLAEEAVRIRADTSGFHSSVASGVLASVGRVAASAAAIFGGIKLGKALFADPISAAGDFEQSLNVLQATSGATNERMKQISDTAMRLGADVRLPAVSASDAANAMLELAKGGFTAKESMEGARGVLLLSTAAQIDGAAAATLVADSIHAFGLRAKDAGVVVDDFAGAANASTATMNDVGLALTQSGQAFHRLHIPVGDAATAIAAMANAGIKGSDAGTSLKTMLQRLNPQTDKAKAAFQAMGVSAYGANGQFVGFRSVIEQLGPKLAGMTDKQKDTALATIFGSDASRAAGIVLGMTAKQWDNLHARVTKAGQAQALANAQTKGFNGAMSGLRSTIETLQLQIGLKMLPLLTRFVRFLSANLPAAASAVGDAFGAIGGVIRDVTRWLGIFDEGVAGGSHGLNGLQTTVASTQTRFQTFMAIVRQVASVVSTVLSAAFVAVRAAVQTTIAIIQGLVSAFNNNRDVAYALAAGVAAGTVAFLAYRAALIVAGAAARAYAVIQFALNAVMAANPIAIVVIAIAALVAALVLLYQRSETARRIMDAAWAGIKAGAQAAMNFISQTVIPAAIAAWNRFGPQVVAVLNTAVAGIRTAVQAIATVVTFVVDQIQAHWRTAWAIFGPLVVAALQVVRTTVQTVLNVVAGVVRVFAAVLRGDWSGAWNALKGIVKDVLNGIASSVGSILRGLAGTALTLASLIGSKIAAGIKTAVAKLAGLAGDLAGRISATASQVAGSAFSYMRSVGFAIADGVLSGVGNLASRLAHAVGSAAKSAASVSLIDIIASSPSKLYADVVGKAIGEGVIMGVEQSLSKLGTTTGKLLKKVADDAKPIAAQLARDLVGVSDKAADEIIKKANEKAKPIADAFGKWATNAKTTFDAGIAKLIAGVDAQFAKAQAKIEAWKAKATPTEALLAAMQAKAAQEAVNLAVGAAEKSLRDLKVKQAADWAALLQTQRENMASLQATFNESRDTALLAGNTFNKGMGAAAGNPYAAQLIYAQQVFDAAKKNFDAGLVTEAEFIAAADALENNKLAAQRVIDEASAASTEATEQQKNASAQAAQAQRLLDEYNAWQAALAQQQTAGAAITNQQSLDQAAQKTMQDTFITDRITANENLHNAVLARTQYALEQKAGAERRQRDTDAAEMNAGLVARHDRILLHLHNVQHAWDIHFDALARQATEGGRTLTQNLANALRNGVQTVAGAADAVAQAIAMHLRLRSPAEKGPLSTLDRWWVPLVPTLLKGLDEKRITDTFDRLSGPSSYQQMRLAQGSAQYASQHGGPTFNRMELLLTRIHKTLEKQKGPGAIEVHVAGSVGIDASVYRARR